MKTALAFAMVAFLSGCAGWNAVQVGVATYSASVADEALITAQWATCNAASVGAVRRKYTGDPEGLAAWQAFCTIRAQRAVTP